MKKILAMLLAASMVLAFAGCAKNEPAPETTVAAEATAAPVETTEAVETEAPIVAMTYEEYVAADLDAAVTILTYVQAHQSWQDDKVTVYCQSPDGAYFLSELACSKEDAAKLVPGTKILVNGYKNEQEGEVEVIGGTFEFVKNGDTFVAEPMDVTALLGTEELIAHQNQLVAFNGMIVEAVDYKNGEPGDDIYVTLCYNGDSYEFCVKSHLTGTESEVYTTVASLNIDDTVNVEGFLYWYQGPTPHITAISMA